MARQPNRQPTDDATGSVKAQLYKLLPYLTEPEPGGPPAPDLAALDPADFDPWGAAHMLATLLKQGMDGPTVLGMFPDVASQIASLNPNESPLASRWRVLQPAELLAPPPPPEYLVGRMIRRPSLTCCYGAPGSLKSMLLMDLAACVATGERWLAPLPSSNGGSYAVPRGPVLWFDADNGERRLRERFPALLQGRGDGSEPLIRAISLPTPPLDMSAYGGLDPSLLAQQIEETGALLCVLDNLGTISGGMDENSSDMVGVMANLRQVAEATGAALMVIHHSRKGNAGGNGSRKGDSLRGHSSIEASLDLALLIERDGSDITMQSTKTRDNEVPASMLRWLWDANPDGSLQRGRFAHVHNVQAEQPRYREVAQELPEIVEELRGQLGDDPNQSQVVAAAMTANTDIQRNTALSAIRHAVSQSWLIEQRKGQHKTAPLLYRVPTPLETVDSISLQGVL